MSIRVTCTGCHVRFNVSEKFAGREGPCPKCKAVIRIPDKTEEVVVHEAEIGPKDSKGRSLVKPLVRRETNLSSVQITLIVGVIVLFLIASLVLRFVFPNPSAFPIWFSWLGAILLAPPCAFVAYTFLRNQELGGFQGKELWLRVGVVGALFAVTWFAMPVAKIAFNDQWGVATWIVSTSAMILIGGAASMLGLDFDYLTGVMHYGFYLACALVSRTLAGIGVLPGWNTDVVPEQSEIAPVLSFLVQQAAGLMACLGLGR